MTLMTDSRTEFWNWQFMIVLHFASWLKRSLFSCSVGVATLAATGNLLNVAALMYTH